MTIPDKKGYFGQFGGRFIPETLSCCVDELNEAYREIKKNKEFRGELKNLLHTFAGRPTPLYFAGKLSRLFGIKVYLKREDLLHTGAHKINNALSQALLAKYMGKKRIIAETGAGQHGVAVATVAALFGFKCDIFMGEEDIRRQKVNVSRMRILGARVVPVSSGTRTLKDACSEAMRDWVTRVKDTYYLVGSTFGPHPYPLLVRDFQSVIGKEARKQILRETGRLPEYLIACVGGGSNAIGLFHPFFKDKKVEFIGVEAGGLGIRRENSASLVAGHVGVLHGTKTYVLQDKFGQVKNAHSVAPGLDYPGVGPEHAHYAKSGRARYVAVLDREALEGFSLLSRQEGIIPALESAHAIAYLKKIKPRRKNAVAVVCLSGRGDKDLDILQEYEHDD
ncbi:MAG: tryptophan synthase subunit beta [Candidatus Omnitrophica bacterium]|nr:tryptophan synthase subunit beta [Candidatus Omnitrophota bacterium]